MSTSTRPLASSTNPSGSSERTYFEQQRELLLQEIGISFEHVLANINKLNRSLEAVTAVGNEFSSVEALWSRFESVMGRGGGEAVVPQDASGGAGGGAAAGEGGEVGRAGEEGETEGSIAVGEEDLEESTFTVEQEQGSRRR